MVEEEVAVQGEEVAVRPGRLPLDAPPTPARQLSTVVEEEVAVRGSGAGEEVAVRPAAAAPAQLSTEVEEAGAGEDEEVADRGVEVWVEAVHAPPSQRKTSKCRVSR